MDYRRLVVGAVLLLGLALTVGCEGSKTTGQAQTHPESKTVEKTGKDGKTTIETSE